MPQLVGVVGFLQIFSLRFKMLHELGEFCAGEESYSQSNFIFLLHKRSIGGTILEIAKFIHIGYVLTLSDL